MSNEIKFFRNNSKVISFKFKKTDGTNWNIPNGNVCKFTVKKSTADSDTNIVIQKEFTGNGGNSYSVFLSGSDTNINVGSYIYDVKDTTANLTLIIPNKFTISEVSLIGSSVVGSQNEDDSVEVVVETGILNNDYAPLTNKPKINSVELSGNKTSADLSMYTKAETNSAIASAVGDITSFDYQVVETLPQTGIKGTIYLTEKTTTEQGDIYNEYLWINSAWEKIGNTSVDISGKLDKVTTTNKLYGTDSVGGQTTYDKSDFASVSDIPTKTSDLTNDSGFLTSHQDISGKLDKVTTATTNKQVYVKNADGTQSMIGIAGNTNNAPCIPFFISPTSVVYAYAWDCQYINVRQTTPTSNSHLTSKQYVDTALSNKQDTLTAGTGISITNNVISVNLTNYENEEF